VTRNAVRRNVPMLVARLPARRQPGGPSVVAPGHAGRACGGRLRVQVSGSLRRPEADAASARL